ncbi:hypothetical protein NN561_004161 [Cricetulus griseus]
MEDNKQLALRIDGAVQSASQEVTNLRAELTATNRRLAELSGGGGGPGSGPGAATSASASAVTVADSAAATMENHQHSAQGRERPAPGRGPRARSPVPVVARPAVSPQRSQLDGFALWLVTLFAWPCPPAASQLGSCNAVVINANLGAVCTGVTRSHRPLPARARRRWPVLFRRQWKVPFGEHTDPQLRGKLFMPSSHIPPLQFQRPLK